MSENEQDYNNVQWKLVYTTNSPIEAEHFKANLEGAEIPVQILSQFDTSRMLTVGDFAIVKIFVPEIFFVDALAIIRDIESTDINTDIDNDDE